MRTVMKIATMGGMRLTSASLHGCDPDHTAPVSGVTAPAQIGPYDKGMFSKNLSRFVITAVALSAITAPALSDNKKKNEPAPLPAYTGPKKRIAVMNVNMPGPESGRASDEFLRVLKQTNGINTLSDVGLKLTEMLETALHQTGRFVMLERVNIDDTREEIRIGEELGNEQTRVKAGSVLGAQMVVRAAVTEFTDNKSSGGGGVNIAGFQFGGAKKVAAVTIDVKFVDPLTSRIVHVASASGDSKSEAAFGGVNFGSVGIFGGGSKEQPIEKATRNAVVAAVQQIITKMETVAWEGRVADMDAETGRATLNRGEDDGLKVGDSLKIYRPGKEIKDPETGESLGRDEDVLVGTGKVSWVSKRVSRVTPDGKMKLGVGFVVKFD